MGQGKRPPEDQPAKEPAEGSRRPVDEALRRTGQKSGPSPDQQPQKDVPPGRQALDD